jgi:glycosyltransferase involved in cell wall biosynthesis
VWGSDVFDFPEISFIHRRIIRNNLAEADMIASTSHIMKEQTLRYVKPKRNIEVTPFGVDVENFRPMDGGKSGDTIRIGMVKALQEKYGVEYFIKAIRLLIDMLVDNGCEELAERIEVPIVGDGYMKGKYIQLSRQLKLESKVNFLGWLPHEKIPYILNTLDIYCAPSILDSESFGVAVIEASACGIPVVVSRIGGLPEVIIDGTTGFLTNPMDEKDIAEYLYKLVIDEGLRKTMGKSGREFVIKNYEWKENAGRLEKIYCSMI